MPHTSLRRTSARPRFDPGAPISTIDSRPILFVVLIMTILVLLAASPMRTHALLVRLPLHQIGGGRIDNPDRLTLAISVTAKGDILFNGTTVSADQLRAFLQEAKRLTPEPAIVFESDGDAPYGGAAQTLAIIHQAGMIGALFCLDGLEKHQHFSKGGGAGTPFPILLSLRLEPTPSAEGIKPRQAFESCAPEQLVSHSWMF